MRTENTIKTLLENSPDGTITTKQIIECTEAYCRSL